MVTFTRQPPPLNSCWWLCSFIYTCTKQPPSLSSQSMIFRSDMTVNRTINPNKSLECQSLNVGIWAQSWSLGYLYKQGLQLKDRTLIYIIGQVKCYLCKCDSNFESIPLWSRSIHVSLSLVSSSTDYRQTLVSLSQNDHYHNSQSTLNISIFLLLLFNISSQMTHFIQTLI